MDYFILTLILTYALVNEVRLRRLKKELKTTDKVISTLLRARMTRIKAGTRSFKDPDIDFDPKTSTRDTDDLPRTGRIGKIHTD